jgi:outer membrane protein OmpU
MKKLLIATTALVATAGVAAADVAVTGNGRMGVVYDGADLNFSSRIRVVFTASGETDGGLSFGGSIRADNAANGANGSAGNIFISGAFGRLAMGDVVGAAEAVIGDLPEIGYTDLSAGIGAFPAGLAAGQNDITFITGDGATLAANNPLALYTYTAGDLTFALSMNDGVGTADHLAAGVKYAFGDYSIALGYEDNGTASHIIVGADAKFGDTAVKAFYGEASDLNFTQYGLGVTSQFDAITVKGYAKVQEAGAVDVTSIGLGAAYSLGGGATVEGGFVDTDAPGTEARYDLGIKFSF